MLDAGEAACITRGIYGLRDRGYTLWDDDAGRREVHSAKQALSADEFELTSIKR